jgi:hypothetical protein
MEINERGSSTEDRPFIGSIAFRLIAAIVFLTVAILDLLKREWLGAASWLVLMIFQEVVPRTFPKEKLIKWSLATLLILLLIVRIWLAVSR